MYKFNRSVEIEEVQSTRGAKPANFNFGKCFWQFFPRNLWHLCHPCFEPAWLTQNRQSSMYKYMCDLEASSHYLADGSQVWISTCVTRRVVRGWRCSRHQYFRTHPMLELRFDPLSEGTYLPPLKGSERPGVTGRRSPWLIDNTLYYMFYYVLFYILLCIILCIILYVMLYIILYYIYNFQHLQGCQPNWGNKDDVEEIAKSIHGHTVW